VSGRYALIVAGDRSQEDADALARALGDPGIGDFEVRQLAGGPAAALRRAIAGFFSDRRRDELLLLHLGCDVREDEAGQLYLAADEAGARDLDGSAVSAESVIRQLARSRAGTVLVLLDARHGGALARALEGRGRAIIAAEGLTAAVVKALETGEADRDQDRWVSLQELYDYVCDELGPDPRPELLSQLEGELRVARSRYVAPVAPARLPAELLEALASPLATTQMSVVTSLSELLASPDPALSEAARRRLEQMAAEDASPLVASAAETALGQAPGPAPPVEERSRGAWWRRLSKPE
jgi:hypothetical protein